MAYSHDAKMYMQCWLFIALNLGCLLWWLRSNGWVAWLAWVSWIITGTIGMGFQIGGVLILIPQPIIMLTHARVRPKHLILMAAGILVLAAGPYAYYRY